MRSLGQLGRQPPLCNTAHVDAGVPAMILPIAPNAATARYVLAAAQAWQLARQAARFTMLQAMDPAMAPDRLSTFPWKPS